jgi:tetratricopeptide (TPR) repeat protein
VELKKRYYKEILISTLFGIILFSYLPQFFQSGDINFFQSSFSRTANIKNPVTGELHSTKHSEDILIELIISDSLLLQNTLSENLEVITTADILLNEDSLQGDFYSLRGMAYFQRAKLLNESAEMIVKSEKDLTQAVASVNINVNYIARAYMTLSDIYLGKNELQEADRAIKKALRANKRIKGVREKLKNINRLKLQ